MCSKKIGRRPNRERGLRTKPGTPTGCRRQHRNDARRPTPDSRLPTLDSRLPTPDSRLPTPDSRLPTPDSRLPTLGCSIPPAGNGLRRHHWRESRMRTAITVAVVFTCAASFGCAPAGDPETTSAQSGAPAAGSRNSHHEWPSGPYQVVENWPKPLPDTRHSHAGWTWGSFGGVYAETPNRIWIAMRGELPLPADAKPWTPYAALTPSRGNAQPNTDGLTATCEPTEKRGWERRFEHVLYVVDGEGTLVDEWAQHDKLFGQQPCGRGPHTIKMSPYDS